MKSDRSQVDTLEYALFGNNINNDSLPVVSGHLALVYTDDLSILTVCQWSVVIWL